MNNAFIPKLLDVFRTLNPNLPKSCDPCFVAYGDPLEKGCYVTAQFDTEEEFGDDVETVDVNVHFTPEEVAMPTSVLVARKLGIRKAEATIREFVKDTAQTYALLASEAGRKFLTEQGVLPSEGAG